MKLVEPLRELFKTKSGSWTQARARRGVRRPAAVSRGLASRPHSGRGHARTAGADAPRDAVVADEVRRDGWYTKLWQSFARLLPVKALADGRRATYEYTAAIRAVESRDGMTADWARLRTTCWHGSRRASVNEVRGIIAWSTTSAPSPPSTIEWE